GMQIEELLAGQIPAEMQFVVSRNSASGELSVECTKLQGPLRPWIHLGRERNPEGTRAIALKGGEPLSKPARPGKKVEHLDLLPLAGARRHYGSAPDGKRFENRS